MGTPGAARRTLATWTGTTAETNSETARSCTYGRRVAQRRQHDDRRDADRDGIDAGFAAEALKVYKPTSPGQRGRITTSRDHLWKGKPLKAPTVGLRKKGGGGTTKGG